MDKHIDASQDVGHNVFAADEPLELVERSQLAGPDGCDLPGPTHVCLVQAGRVRASLEVVPAELADLGPAARRTPQQLAHTAVLRALSRDDPALLPLLVYFGLRRARIWGRHTVAARTGRDAPLTDLLALERLTPDDRGEPEHTRDTRDMRDTEDIDLGQGELRAQRLDLALHRAFTACAASQRALCQRHMLAEAVAILARHARRFADTAWTRAVAAGRLSRAQYVATLASTHQYVRFTPRLLARAIAVSPDEELREHFLAHLDGERRHDRLIEADLRHLGADLDFVRDAMVPAPATLAFMAVQESTIGFHQDPILFMAAPFVAEGLAAAVPPDLLAALADNIRAWGHDPLQATRFLRSHVHLDGGDDGHWQRTCALLGRRLADEGTQQRFLATVQLAADAFVRSYDAHVDDLCVFSPAA